MPDGLTALRLRAARNAARVFSDLRDRPGAASLVPRAERAFEELPMSFGLYAPEALAAAFGRTAPGARGSNGALFALSPRRFAGLAAPMPVREGTQSEIDALRRALAGEPARVGDAEAMDPLRLHGGEFRGLAGLPDLVVDREWGRAPGSPYSVLGHDGRHRMRAIAALLGEDEPVLARLLPEYERYADDILAAPRLLPERSLRFRPDPEEVEWGPLRRYARGGLAPAVRRNLGRGPEGWRWMGDLALPKVAPAKSQVYFASPLHEDLRVHDPRGALAVFDHARWRPRELDERTAMLNDWLANAYRRELLATPRGGVVLRGAADRAMERHGADPRSVEAMRNVLGGLNGLVSLWPLDEPWRVGRYVKDSAPDWLRALDREGGEDAVIGGLALRAQDASPSARRQPKLEESLKELRRLLSPEGRAEFEAWREGVTHPTPMRGRQIEALRNILDHYPRRETEPYTGRDFPLSLNAMLTPYGQRLRGLERTFVPREELLRRHPRLADVLRDDPLNLMLSDTYQGDYGQHLKDVLGAEMDAGRLRESTIRRGQLSLADAVGRAVDADMRSDRTRAEDAAEARRALARRMGNLPTVLEVEGGRRWVQLPSSGRKPSSADLDLACAVGADREWCTKTRETAGRYLSWSDHYVLLDANDLPTVGVEVGDAARGGKLMAQVQDRFNVAPRDEEAAAARELARALGVTDYGTDAARRLGLRAVPVNLRPRAAGAAWLPEDELRALLGEAE